MVKTPTHCELTWRINRSDTTLRGRKEIKSSISAQGLENPQDFVIKEGDTVIMTLIGTDKDDGRDWVTQINSAVPPVN